MHPGEPWAQPGVRHVTVDGIPVAVETVHNGAPPGQAIAWLHGLGSSAIHAFAKVVRHPALAGTVSLLIDLPGHGWSGGPDGWAYIMEARADNVSSVLRGILNRPVTLMGHFDGRHDRHCLRCEIARGRWTPDCGRNRIGNHTLVF